MSIIVNFTKRAIEAFVSKDKFRPSMTGVYYDPNDNVLVATNSHIIVVIHDITQTFEENTEENFNSAVILPTEAFPTKKGFKNSIKRINSSEIEVTELNKSGEVIGKRILKVIQENYPPYKTVMPNKESIKAIENICVDFNNFTPFQQLWNELSGSCEYEGMKLSFTSCKNGILVETITNVFTGVIMPMRDDFNL